MGLYTKVAGAWVEIGVDGGGGGMTWAKVTGGTVTEVTNPDGSVDEVHTFTANGSLTVESPGYARVLLVGGGSGSTQGAEWRNGGSINEGILSLPAGALPVVVSATRNDGSQVPPSTLGSYTSGATAPSYANRGVGHGGTDPAWATGHSSSISGSAVTYSARDSYTTPGCPTQNGIVIVRVQKSAPASSGVVATGGTVTEYTGDGSNGVLGQKYKMHTFTADGTFTVTQGGECDVFLVGGGAGGSRNFPDAANGRGGNAGTVSQARLMLDAGTFAAVVGAGGSENGGAGGQSRFGTNLLAAAGGTNKGGSGAGNGASGVGGDGAGDNGGAGVQFAGSWYAGGGGAGGHGGGATVTPGLGGSGVGGDGAVLGSGLPPANTTNSGVNPAMNGKANTGSGGGASGTWFSPGQSDWGRGGAGGTGVVIVRYKVDA